MIIFIFLLVVFFILLLFNTDLKLIIKYDGKSEYYANLEVYLFGILKIFVLNFTENGVSFLFFKIPYKKIKMDREKFKLNKIKYILKNLDWKLEKLNLLINVGLKNTELTVISVFFIATLLSIIPMYYSKKIKSRNYNYNIIPIYNKNTLYFKLSLEIRLKNINIIKAFFLIKKCKIKNKQHLNNVRKLVKI